MAHDPYTLPPDLPVPADDGGADHLPGAPIPALDARLVAGARSTSPSSQRSAASSTSIRAPARRGSTRPTGWDAFPGARGCTPQSCAFRDHAAELARARSAGRRASRRRRSRSRSSSPSEPTCRIPVIADPGLRAARRARPADLRDRRHDALQAARARRRARAGREGLLPRLPARPERGRRRSPGCAQR